MGGPEKVGQGADETVDPDSAQQRLHDSAGLRSTPPARREAHPLNHANDGRIPNFGIRKTKGQQALTC